MACQKSACGNNSTLRYQKWFLNAFRAAHAIFESISLHATKSFKSWIALEELNHHLTYMKEMNLTKCLFVAFVYLSYPRLFEQEALQLLETVRKL